MNTKKFALMAVAMSISIVIIAQTPMDPVIAKFNEGAAKVNSGDFKAAIGSSPTLTPSGSKSRPRRWKPPPRCRK